MSQTVDFRKCGIELLFFSGLIMIGVLPFWRDLGVVPNLLSIVVYLWTLYRPDLMSKRIFVVMGIVRDAIMGYPLGLGIIELILISAIANVLRRYILDKGFWVVFSGFIFFTVLNNILFWFMISWAKDVLLPFSGAIRATGANILLYPIMSLVSLKVQHYIDSYPRKRFT